MPFATENRLIIVLFAAILSLCPVASAFAASLHDTINTGNKLFQQEKYDEALRSYVDAQIEHPEDVRLKYNIASSHYKMKNYEEALKGYLDVAATAQNAALEEKALYNAGNALYRQGKLEDAVEYYKKALSLDPDDKDAQQNLEFVREEIKRRINESKDTSEKQKQQQEQKQDKTCPNPQQQGLDNQTQQGKQDQQQQQNADNQTGNQGSQQQQQPAEQDNQQQAGQEQQQSGEKNQRQEGAPQQTRQMSKEEAEQWLNSIQENRDNLKDKKQQPRGQGTYRPGKDW